MTKVKKYLMYVSISLSSLAFALAGAAKLAGVEQMHMSFALMGLPVWFGYFIGASEFAGAIGLWLKKLSVYAASGLLIIMAGAIYFHLVYDAAAHAIPAIILALLMIHIIVSRRKEQAIS